MIDNANDDTSEWEVTEGTGLLTYNVIFSDLALKQLRKLDREIGQRIISTLERIRIRPDAYVKKLVGVVNHYIIL